jgi:DNA-directed RNA polymerase subunit RPC12/RpoP
MAVRFRCPKCGKRLTVEQAAGEQVSCPHCGQAAVVPADAKPVPAGPPGPAALQQAMAAGAAAEPEAPKEEKKTEEEEQPEESGSDTVMGWLALYLPSWGTSVVLHAAVIVLAAFLSWQVYEPQKPFQYTSDVVTTSKQKTHRRQQTKMQDAEPSRGKLTPRPSSFLRNMQNPFPDVADNRMEVLEVIGVGGGGKMLGGFEGLGTGGRGSGFFGAGGSDEANKIVYVVDRSGSMTDSIDYVKFELKRAIGELGDEKSFHIVFYSSGPSVEMPTRRLVDATDRNKQLAYEFIDGIIPHGQTDPSEALKRAFECRPELVYLLTDGEFDRAIVDLVRQLNTGQRVTVHTIGFLYDIGEKVLKDIAGQNRGKYKFVSEKDLATLGQ